MKQIKAIIQPHALDRVLLALEHLEGLPGISVSDVSGWGRGGSDDEEGSAKAGRYHFVKKTKLEIVVNDEDVDRTIQAIADAAHSGRAGDGKIFISDVEDTLRIRTGERGRDAV